MRRDRSMGLQEVNCYNCGSDNSVFYDSENGFNLVRCAGCGILYVNPRPCDKDITRAMMTGMHGGEETLNVIGNNFDEKKVMKYLSILEDIYGDSLIEVQRARWLDIGCGYGEFMAALQLHTQGKIKTIGSEPIPAKVEGARSRNLDVSFIDLDRHTDRYDYVSLLNVYSHLPNPVKTIGQWMKLLESSGELLLESGHSSHLSSRDHHKPYYLPDHLSFANREILVDILERLGFEIVSVHVYRHTVFPEFRPIPILKELVRVGLGRSTLRHIFPRKPDRDIYIRARLKNSE